MKCLYQSFYLWFSHWISLQNLFNYWIVSADECQHFKQNLWIWQSHNIESQSMTSYCWLSYLWESVHDCAVSHIKDVEPVLKISKSLDSFWTDLIQGCTEIFSDQPTSQNLIRCLKSITFHHSFACVYMSVCLFESIIWNNPSSLAWQTCMLIIFKRVDSNI